MGKALERGESSASGIWEKVSGLNEVGKIENLLIISSFGNQSPQPDEIVESQNAYKCSKH